MQVRKYEIWQSPKVPKGRGKLQIVEGSLPNVLGEIKHCYLITKLPYSFWDDIGTILERLLGFKIKDLSK